MERIQAMTDQPAAPGSRTPRQQVEYLTANLNAAHMMLADARAELAAAQKKLDAIRAALQERPAIMAVGAIEAVLRGE